MGVRFERIVAIVLDSVGIGELPDAGQYGDEGSDTLGNIARRVPLHLPTLRHLGLDRLVPSLGGHAGMPAGAWGRMAEASAGKDSVTGHWEMAGIVLDKPFPTFPNGFPPEVMAAFEGGIGRPALGNVVASGTEVIERFGAEHLRTGAPIVYTSADSVFQIAAHEDVVPVADLYRWCEFAYELVGEGLGVGRIIARPFVGRLGSFRRTSNRHDYALEPPLPTLLDYLTGAGHPVFAVGKIRDLFAGRGITRHLATATDDDGMDCVEEAMREVPRGLIWANLVDFDAIFGHRNNVEGYARNLERFDARLADLLPQLRPTDLLLITADHGNDPTTPSTDHSREYVPLLATGARVAHGVSLGTRETFADLGQTIAANFAVTPLPRGTSFLEALGGDLAARPSA
jgi:phosphopentomutase